MKKYKVLSIWNDNGQEEIETITEKELIGLIKKSYSSPVDEILNYFLAGGKISTTARTLQKQD